VELVGRQWEMAGADRFLDAVSAGPAALVLEGEPGIGKTTIWRAAVDAARKRSCRVLVCRASESESALSFLGLGDLLDSVSDAMLDALPEPQRRALELALLRSAGEGSPDRVAVARGTLAVLRAAASEMPTVLAIDDVQWLDAPSADVVRFVVHRLTEERLGLLASVREGESSTLELDRGFPGAGLSCVHLQALPYEELEDVVRAHLPVNFTHATWRALYRISAGNPFFALQLAEALERRGDAPSVGELPVPTTLAEAMRERLTALSPDARAALLPIAALAQPSLGLVRAGAAEPAAVEEAIRAGVLQLDGDRLRFAHPLLGSLVYEDVSETERQAVHKALAQVVTDDEERAIHLARGTVEPDEAIAATLEAAADHAARRGHPEVAAELAEHAARLTPDERTDDRARRVRNAATFIYVTGDGPRSCGMLERLIGMLPPSPERAQALRLLGWFVDDIPRCREILEQALAETGEDLQLRSQVLTMLAAKECWADAGRRRRASSGWRPRSPSNRAAVVCSRRRPRASPGSSRVLSDSPSSNAPSSSSGRYRRPSPSWTARRSCAESFCLLSTGSTKHGVTSRSRMSVHWPSANSFGWCPRGSSRSSSCGPGTGDRGSRTLAPATTSGDSG